MVRETLMNWRCHMAGGKTAGGYKRFESSGSSELNCGPRAPNKKSGRDVQEAVAAVVTQIRSLQGVQVFIIFLNFL